MAAFIMKMYIVHYVEWDVCYSRCYWRGPTTSTEQTKNIKIGNPCQL